MSHQSVYRKEKKTEEIVLLTECGVTAQIASINSRLLIIQQFKDFRLDEEFCFSSTEFCSFCQTISRILLLISIYEQRQFNIV